jgi:hypothetical protein
MNESRGNSEVLGIEAGRSFRRRPLLPNFAIALSSSNPGGDSKFAPIELLLKLTSY